MLINECVLSQLSSLMTVASEKLWWLQHHSVVDYNLTPVVSPITKIVESCRRCVVAHLSQCNFSLTFCFLLFTEIHPSTMMTTSSSTTITARAPSRTARYSYKTRNYSQCAASYIWGGGVELALGTLFF